MRSTSPRVEEKESPMWEALLFLFTRDNKTISNVYPQFHFAFFQPAISFLFGT